MKKYMGVFAVTFILLGTSGVGFESAEAKGKHDTLPYQTGDVIEARDKHDTLPK
ncbi:hypothetical protein [Shouchella patagoniensis]|uniref:hypothetical protein n=1 Tax=Shouchella patagoniensis TaxID=228576 RepID=UPI0014754551|nr:hypothetical protein [Shouchella patagoniensis]